MTLVLAFLIGLAILLFLAIRLKISAFVALLVSAVVIGLLSGLPADKVIHDITGGFGKILSSIGIVIIFGVILGKYLEDGGAARRLALASIRALGQKNSPAAMSISGYLVSIPVFSDVAYVILVPLAKAISNRSGMAFAVLAVALLSGLQATQIYVPPTPGPLAVAGLLNLDIGRVIMYGGISAIFMTMFGWAYAVFWLRKTDPQPWEYDAAEAAAMADQGDDQDKNLPGLFASLFPLLLPMVLILLNTTSAMMLGKGHVLTKVFDFVGDANVALALGTLAAVVTLGHRLGREKILDIVDDSLKTAGPIIFITAAGGSLGAVLKDSGVGNAVAAQVAGSGLPFILIPFVISGLLKTIQGSGTVAVITSATLCAPLAEQLGIDPILIFLATGAGARLICHVNDSLFWIFTKMNGYDMKTGLRTMSASSFFMALGGLFGTWIVQMFLL
ncbi:Gluconate transporter family protein [Rhodovulum sp. PH10]|uniref:GntP family permease n=1 Tax=Rhodovulum sp. PH10 TaxID=1187851 RepID=UPI00027C2DE2|nr:gluconate:H+ symporter [Rhodovulum sp. PH10]EJW09935.1 Gluconate transporter family protein [Rhodovulum sp. PH10]